MITYQEEKLSDMFDEYKEVSKAHWAEIGAHPNLNIDWDVYLALEKSGALHITTVRDSKSLVGYVVHILVPHPHYKDRIIAENDNMFLLKEYRKGFAGYTLMKNAIKNLKTKANIITMRTKELDVYKNIMKRLKLKPSEYVFSMEV